MGILIRPPRGQTYRCISADPPWKLTGGGRIKRGADRHYPLLATRDIPPTIVASPLWRPDPGGCHLWLWVVNNFLPDGLWVMEQLGFRYVTTATWAKDRFATGYYLRGQTEQLLFGVMGKLPPVTRAPGSTLIEAKRQAHSQKPDEAYVLIEAVSPGPRLEMFARAPRPGWNVWGNEV